MSKHFIDADQAIGERLTISAAEQRRREIAQQLAEFKKRGGKIKKIPAGACTLKEGYSSTNGNLPPGIKIEAGKYSVNGSPQHYTSLEKALQAQTKLKKQKRNTVKKAK